MMVDPQYDRSKGVGTNGGDASAGFVVSFRVRKRANSRVVVVRCFYRVCNRVLPMMSDEKTHANEGSLKRQ